MKAVPASAEAELKRQFETEESASAIQRNRLGCVLGMIFMPAGAGLDWVVNHDRFADFLWLRMACSGLLFVVWLLQGREFGKRNPRLLGLVEVSLPLFFISWMIKSTTGAQSPYYAGLNLVLMGSGIVLRWTFWDSIWCFIIGIVMYFGACLMRGQLTPEDRVSLFNNVYFLAVTGVFVVVGNSFYVRTRFAEFKLGRQLKRNEEELRAVNSRLQGQQDALAESNRQLSEKQDLLELSYEKLRNLDEAKSRFFANISHELRTPLTVLLGPLERLRRQFGPGADDDMRTLLDTMEANGMRLLKLINDLLDLARLESAKMQVSYERIELHSFLLGVLQAIKPAAADKHIRLEHEFSGDLGECALDRDKMEKILYNLLFNAIKFTGQNGTIILSAKREGVDVVLAVADNGKGISAEEMPHIFDRFWQADTSSKRKFQGAGIGLALVKELAEVQGGSVRVQSEVGKGATMTVTLPATHAENPRPEAAGEEQQTAGEQIPELYRRAQLFPAMASVHASVKQVEVLSRSKKPVVLVADDEPDMLQFLNSELRAEFEVIEAVDGDQAVQKAAQFLPDVILVDMMMPEKDGLQACREIRAHSTTRGIPVIMLTARADNQTKLAALGCGANDFLTKPFSTTELHVRVRNLIANRNFEKTLARQNQVLEATLEDLKETEVQLVQSEKLASLGRLSAGIIHEINNPLNYANTGTDILKKYGKLIPESERADYDDTIKDVKDGIDRVRRIVSDLRSFTHPNTDSFNDVSVADCVESTLRFLSHEWRDRVEIETRFEPEASFWGNQHQVVQILLNLMQNAMDAFKKKEFGAEQPRIVVAARGLDGKTLVSIRDNGPGISSEHINKIFDPFFTTKEVGEGMGLGLSICFRIMQAHEGRISVRSEPGQWTEFTLEFPSRVEKERAA